MSPIISAIIYTLCIIAGIILILFAVEAIETIISKCSVKPYKQTKLVRPQWIDDIDYEKYDDEHRETTIVFIGQLSYRLHWCVSKEENYRRYKEMCSVLGNIYKDEIRNEKINQLTNEK